MARLKPVGWSQLVEEAHVAVRNYEEHRLYPIPPDDRSSVRAARWVSMFHQPGQEGVAPSRHHAAQLAEGADGLRRSDSAFELRVVVCLVVLGPALGVARFGGWAVLLGLSMAAACVAEFASLRSRMAGEARDQEGELVRAALRDALRNGQAEWTQALERQDEDAATTAIAMADEVDLIVARLAKLVGRAAADQALNDLSPSGPVEN